MVPFSRRSSSASSSRKTSTASRSSHALTRAVRLPPGDVNRQKKPDSLTLIALLTPLHPLCFAPDLARLNAQRSRPREGRKAHTLCPPSESGAVTSLCRNRDNYVTTPSSVSRSLEISRLQHLRSRRSR